MSDFILNYDQIQRILPQRYPFVLIDRVIEFKKGESLVAVKNISANEWPFTNPGGMSSSSIDGPPGAFAAGADIFPRSLLIEAAAQAALILYHLSMVKEGEHPRYILGRVKAEFFEDVKVGEECVVTAFADKMMKIGGYSHILIVKKDVAISKAEIFYNVTWS